MASYHLDFVFVFESSSHQKLGFHNITVIEKGNRIGGKSWTVQHRGTNHEMGCSYFDEFDTEVQTLVNDFNVSVHKHAGFSLWPNIKSPLTEEAYLLAETAFATGTSDPAIILSSVADAIKKYVAIHWNMFGEYKGVLMPKPHDEEMSELKGTIKDFLKRNDLLILQDIFRLLFTADGFGHVDETAAVYGLMHITPKRLIRVLTQFLYPDETSHYGLVDGFSNLWETIVKTQNINVKLNKEVSYVIRTPDHVYLTLKDNVQSGKKETFDYLVIAASMNEMLNVLDTTWAERRLFSMLTPSFFTNTLLDTNVGARAPIPISLYMYNVKSHHDHEVSASRDYFAIMNGITGVNYSTGALPVGADGLYLQSIVVSQYGKSYPSVSTINGGILRFTSDFDITKGSALLRKTWNFFPRFNPREAENGFLWDIFGLQGQRNTWYIGSSVSFESINAILNYNNLIIQNAFGL